MLRAQRLMLVWRWLPVFRAVAEVGSLAQAAELLSVTPAAVSKTLSLLEAALGTSLFLRTKRGMELLPEGQRLLVEVRDAMRRLDDALPAPAQENERAPTPLRVGVTGVIAGFCMYTWVDTLSALGRPLELHVLRAREVPTQLLAGELDCVVSDAAIRQERLVLRSLGQIATHYAWQGPRLAAPTLRLPPAIAPVAERALRCGPVCVPQGLALPRGTKSESGPQVELFRVTRERPDAVLRNVLFPALAKCAQRLASERFVVA